ncbi:MAG: tetratricopeptide repeat protein [Desulfobacterales bacterium]|nr:tetratricopeptide repeat protein [Desulfobacterales bacterium]
MKKVAVLTIVFWYLAITSAWCQDAGEFYKRGIESTLACKKIEYFTKALQLDPGLADAYEKRAVHYYFQGRLDNAIEDYTKVIKLKPQAADAYRMRGMAYLKKGHGEGMMAEIKRLVHRRRHPGVPENRNSLERAIDNFSRAIELEPQNANAYSYRAQAYCFNRKFKEAILDATRALQLQGDQKSIAKAYDVLAQIYQQGDQDEQYAAAYRSFVELDPYAQDYPPLHVPLFLKNYTTNAKALKAVSRFGLLILIVICFALIFRLKLRAPKKKDGFKDQDLDHN